MINKNFEIELYESNHKILNDLMKQKLQLHKMSLNYI